MATTNRIASDTLAVGEMSASATLSFSSERLVLDFTAAQVGTEDSLVRLVVRDSLGRVVLTDSIFGSDTQRSSLESAQAAASGSLTASIECLKGSATVQLDEITGTAAFGTGASGALVQTADLAAGILTAAAAGRAKMADDYFTTTEFVAGAGGKFAPGALDTAGIANTVADDAFTTAEFAAGAGGKFAAGALNNAGLQNLLPDDVFTVAEFVAGAGGKFAAGCLVTAGIQNLFAANSMDGAACAAVFANGAIPGAKLAAGPFSLDTPIADPGAGGAIPVVTSGTCNLTTVGPEAYNLAVPTIIGQALMLNMTVDAGAATVTVASAIDARGTTVVVLDEVGEWILLVGIDAGAGVLAWRVVGSGNSVTGGAGPYVQNAIPDPAAGNPIVITTGGRCTFTIAAPGDDRSLAAPSFEGQQIVLESLAGSVAGTVTVTNGFNRAGATVLNFRGGVNESLTLVAKVVAGALRWRVLEDASGVASQIAAIVAAAAIPVTYDDGITLVNIAAPADDRTLPDASYVGQRLTIVHSAGANAGTITAASDINPLVGGQNVINFTAALGEMVVLQATSTLAWRIVTNPNALVLS